MARLGLSVADVEVRDSRETIPPGVYPAKIVETDVEEKEFGSSMKVVFEILDGDHQGRKMWSYQNIIHTTSSIAQTIAQEFLKKICVAIGHPGNIEETEELHDVPLEITVGNIVAKTEAQKKREKDYGQQTEVKNVKPLGATAPDTKAPAGKPSTTAKPAADPKTTTAAAPAAGTRKAWGNK